MTPTIFIPYAKSRAAKQATRSLIQAGYCVAIGIPGPQNRQRLAPAQLPTILEHPCPYRDYYAFLNWIDNWLRKNPSSIVLPIDESAVQAVGTLADNENYADRLICPPATSLRVSLSKYYATKIALQAGIATPTTTFLREPNTSQITIPSDSPFPALLKWDNAITQEGRYEKGNTRLVSSREELDIYCAELQPRNCGMILQQLVPGTGVGAFILKHRYRTILRFAHRRIHEVPWTGGVSAYCESSQDSELLQTAEHLLDFAGYEGVAMVEFRKHKGEPPVFLEINGRLWGSIGLAIAAGANFPQALVDCYIYGNTNVASPKNIKRVSWHEPKLELEHLHSLWTTPPGPTDCAAPKIRNTISVLLNFLNPKVHNDWWDWHDIATSAKMYIRLARREAAWLKSKLINSRRPKKQDPILDSAILRTKEWISRPTKTENILFVCYGNICRSPYAEKRWNTNRHSQTILPNASSAGLHKKVERETPQRFQSIARYLGVELHDHRSKRLNAQLLNSASAIFVMDVQNLHQLRHEAPAYEHKVYLLGALGDEPHEIEDPYQKPIGKGGQVYMRIDRELARLHKALDKTQ